MRCVPEQLRSLWVLGTLLFNLAAGNALILYFGPADAKNWLGILALNTWPSLVAVGVFLAGFHRVKPQNSVFRTAGLGVVCTALVPMMAIGLMCVLGALLEGKIALAVVQGPLISVMVAFLMLPILLPFMVVNAVLFVVYQERHVGKEQP